MAPQDPDVAVGATRAGAIARIRALPCGTIFAMGAIMRRAAAIAALLLAAGCGGETFVDAGDGGIDRDAAPSDASTGDAGASCTPLPGCTSTTMCPDPDGCNTCYCSGGQWGCTARACVDAAPPVCPATEPPNGSACAANGLRCTYGARCGPSCACLNGSWSCAIPPCPPPPQCPQTPPGGGSSCDGWQGEMCNYPSPTGCGGEVCSCPDTTQPSWKCLIGDCIDASPPPIDAGAHD